MKAAEGKRDKFELKFGTKGITSNFPRRRIGFVRGYVPKTNWIIKPRFSAFHCICIAIYTRVYKSFSKRSLFSHFA